MINLNEQRLSVLHVCPINLKDLPEVDLETIQFGDWMEGFGTVSDYGILGFLRQAGRLGLQLKKRDE